jgi:hypothetical protein
MAIDLIAKFSVIDKVNPFDNKEIFDPFLAPDEQIIFRIIIKYKRIKSYHFVLAVSNRNRIFAYQIVSKWTTEYIILN